MHLKQNRPFFSMTWQVYYIVLLVVLTRSSTGSYAGWLFWKDQGFDFQIGNFRLPAFHYILGNIATSLPTRSFVGRTKVRHLFFVMNTNVIVHNYCSRIHLKFNVIDIRGINRVVVITNELILTSHSLYLFLKYNYKRILPLIIK